MTNISSPLTLLQISPLDAKLCNWYVSGANVVIESISEYLTRVTINRRIPAALVTMMIPKEGYTPSPSYPYATVSDVMPFFDIKFYHFKDGLDDENFVEFISENVQSEYLWYLHQKSVPPISEPTNVQITVNGTGSVQGPIPEGGFVVWAVNEYGSTLPVDVPAFDLLTDSTEAVITWDAVEGATGYIVTSRSDASAHFEVEGTSVNLFSMPVLGEVTIPTENTTAVLGFKIENDDTVDVVGEGIDVEFSEDEEDSTKKIVTLKKQQSDWNEEDTESPNYIANKPTIPEGGGGGGIRSTGAFLAGFSLSSGTINIGLTDSARIYWCQVSWVLLDNDDGNGNKEDGGVIDILVGYDNNGQAFVHTANEITFTSSRISGMSIAVDSDVGSMIVNSLTLNVTFVGDSNPYMFICNSRYDQEEIPEDPL